MNRGGYESSDRSVNDLRPPPGGPAPGARRVLALHKGDRVFVGDREFTYDGTRLVEAGAPPEPPRHRRLAERLIDVIFCPACLCLRIHPTHLLVCSDRRRKVIHRARR